jgi:hypothetical protein
MEYKLALNTAIKRGIQSAQASRHGDTSLINENNNYINRLANLYNSEEKRTILNTYHDAYKTESESYGIPRGYSGTW